MNENRILLFLCISLCSSFLGLYVFIEIEQWSQYKEYGKLPFSNNKPPPFNSAAVVASALTSITNSPVITYHDYLSRDKNDTRIYERLDFPTFYKAYLSGGIISSHHRHKGDDENKNLLFGVYIESLTGAKLFVENLNRKTTVQELKERIQENGMASDIISQHLVFEGQHLLNTVKLGAYHIGQGHVIYLDIRPHEGSLYPIKFLDSDFSKLHLEERRRKGHHKDHNKCEWKRILLTPSTKRIRSWPSSYHGTSTHNARTIADDGLLYSKNHRFNGIYTTPDIDFASSYAQSFVYHGSKYLILLENRVNPKTLVKLSFRKGGEYWVSQGENDVKPFGLLIKKIGYCR